MSMWTPETLAMECNRIKDELMMMPPDVRDAWVRDVLRWFISVTQEMTNEMLEASKGGLLSKAKLLSRVKEIRAKYGEVLDKKKPQIIVALTYAIKEEYQEMLGPFLYSMLGLI